MYAQARARVGSSIIRIEFNGAAETHVSLSEHLENALFPITNSRPLRKKSWASTFLVPPAANRAFSGAFYLILSAAMISCVSSSCTAKMSVRSRSKRSAQICAPLSASISWPVTRTRLPALRTLPSST